MGVVKLNKTKQKRLRVVSKIIYILAMLGKIFTRIGVVAIILAMFIVMPILKNVDVNRVDDVIEIKVQDETIKIEDVDGKLIAVVGGEKVDLEMANDRKEFDKVISVFADNSKEKLMAAFITAMVFAAVELVLTSIILGNLEELFKNIYIEDTPFTQENVGYIRKMTYFIIATTVLGIISSIVVNLIIPNKFNLNIGFGLIEILIVYALGHIFEYGYELQLDSQAKIYGDDNE